MNIEMMMCEKCEKKFTMNQIHDVNGEAICDNCFHELAARAEMLWEMQNEEELV